MASKTERAPRVLPSLPSGDFVRSRALSPHASVALHNAPGRSFFARASEAVRRQTPAQVAGCAVAGGIECEP